MQDTEFQSIWMQFVASRQASLRERLIDSYLPLAKRVAARAYRLRRDDSVPFDDYLQYARVGLVEAVDRYNPLSKASFETFSSYRIRGAILNGLGKESEVGAQRAYWRLHTRERMDSIAPRALHWSGNAGLEDFIAITVGLALGYLLEESSDIVDSSVGSNPYEAVELAQLRTLSRELVEQLPEREGTLIRLHYFEHQEFQLIAEEFGITKGRVSQLHSQALGRLRDLLGRACGLDRSV